MALTLGNVVVGTIPSFGSTINGSVNQHPANRSRFGVVASERVSSTAMHSKDRKATKRVADETITASLKGVVEKAKSLWWTPLAGASVEEFWLNIPEASKAIESVEEQAAQVTPMAPAGTTASVPLQEVVEAAIEEKRSRKSTVTFTPEKARALRKSLRNSKTWHDGWYHSAIASRLAEENQ